jgi:hypothetical protein
VAEIQWVVEVRCVNTLLAAFKVGERGQHICLHVPDRELDPHEFGKLIDAAEEARRIAEEHRSACGGSGRLPQDAAPIAPGMGTVAEIEGRSDLYHVQVLSTGEIVLIDIPGAVLGPSELEQFIAEMKGIQSRLAS